MKRVSLLIAAYLLSFAAHGEVFKDGETVCFLGDSITHGGRFHSIIYDYYLTRFPERKIHFVNAGVSGDSAGGALGRLDEDVTAKKPTAVAIMFGMNDVGRGNYVAVPDESRKAAQQRALDSYQTNMEKLVGRIRGEAGNPRLLFITPSPFDQSGVNEHNNNQPGCNDGLGRCSAVVREISTKNNGLLVDFHAPMTAFNAEQQKGDPAYTLVGPDRVHPGTQGHVMMAWLFLKSQGAPALVSKVVIDAKTGQVAECANATVTGLTKNGGACHFTVLEQALPFPIDAAAQPILERLPIEQDLNQEIVAVKGLASGTYELRIDDVAVGRYTAESLERGVNIAMNVAAPQVIQAQEVAKVNETRRSTETTLRHYAATRWFLKHRQVNPDDLSAVQVFAETKMAKTGYYESKVPDYLKQWEKRGEVIARLAALEQKAYAARQPVSHAYVVCPVP